MSAAKWHNPSARRWYYETCNVGELYQASCVHEQACSGHSQWAWLWWPTTTTKNYLWWSWTVPNNSNQFFTNFDWLVTFTQIAQMPRCQDLVIFVMITDRQQTNLITLPLVHVHRVIIHTGHFKTWCCFHWSENCSRMYMYQAKLAGFNPEGGGGASPFYMFL